MQSQNWLRLTDYASKYRISISTLRRRIKTGQIAFRFEEGRYFIVDEPGGPGDTASAMAQPASSATVKLPLRSAPGERQSVSVDEIVSDPAEEPILSSASRLLSELKRAYTSILQEKEEQIIQLKEEVSDLKTLVRVLEDDNERMRRLVPRN